MEKTDTFLPKETNNFYLAREHEFLKINLDIWISLSFTLDKNPNDDLVENIFEIF